MNTEKNETFVRILYPGVLFDEGEVYVVKMRDPDKVMTTLPVGAYAFYFYDQTSKEVEVDGEKQKIAGKQKKKSGRYFPDGTVFTLREVKKLEGDHRILISNMEGNGYEKVVRTRRGNYQPFEKDDLILDTKAPRKESDERRTTI